MKIKTIYLGQDKAVPDKLNTDGRFLEAIQIEHPLNALKRKDGVGLIIIEEPDNVDDGLWLTKFIKEHLDDTGIILFVMTGKGEPMNYLKAGADDQFALDSSVEDIETRLLFLRQHKSSVNSFSDKKETDIALPIWKRTFDIVFAGIALLVLSPAFMIIALLIRLESKGKVFYSASRIGKGYKRFDFYKFRSMYTDADKRIDDLMALNQYSGENSEKIRINTNKLRKGISGDPILYSDDDSMLESELLRQKKTEQGNSFFKLVNDPRITKVGRFIRNTSIDELPQLINILKGDMSVVGNRPLPSYEAELLTTDRWIKRFLAPAGLTGLWQVTKRGGAEKMSADERKQLDIDYALDYSFAGDMKIILKTIPAMKQHENV